MSCRMVSRPKNWRKTTEVSKLFSLIRDCGKQNTRGNISKISVSLVCYWQQTRCHPPPLMRNLIQTLMSRSTSCPLHQFLQRVWPNFQNLLLQIWPAKSKSVPSEVQPYFPIRDELLVDHGVLLKGLRVVVPQTLHIRSTLSNSTRDILE